MRGDRWQAAWREERIGQVLQKALLLAGALFLTAGAGVAAGVAID